MSFSGFGRDRSLGSATPGGGRNLNRNGSSFFPDLLATSLTSNSTLDYSDEDLREEDVWGSSNADENSKSPSEKEAAEEEDMEAVQRGTPIRGGRSSLSQAQRQLEKQKGLAGGTPTRVIPAPAIATPSSGAAFNRSMRRQSAPVNVPDWSKITGVVGGNESKSSFLVDDDSEDENEEADLKGGAMVPPHEMLAKEYSQSVTFSVYSGAGRTLRGRDLNSMRTAVLRQTGFLDS